MLAEIERLTSGARPGANGHGRRIKSLGEQFITSSQYKSLQDSGIAIGDRRGIVQLSVKAVTVAAAGGLVTRNVREPDTVSLVRRRLTVRDLLTAIQVNSPSVEYAKQTTRTNNAAPAGWKPTRISAPSIGKWCGRWPGSDAPVG